MGSCISKFSSKNKETQNFVQDKLVIISQPPISSNTIPPKPPCPSSSPSQSPTSTSSFSSFYYSTSANTTTTSSSSNVPLSSSLSSSSSCSSSIIFPKERPTTFSNDFLKSCVTQNPQVTSRVFNDPVKVDQNPEFDKYFAKKPSNTSTLQVTKPIVASPRRYTNTPKKRSRANSPNLTRQKSLRRDLPEIRPNTPSRYIRSHSPARRFSSDHNYSYKATLINQMTPTERHRRPLDSKGNSWFGNGEGKENVATSNSQPDVLSKNYGRSGEKYISKQELPADEQDINSILMDDINNPHIALDCFIFL